MDSKIKLDDTVNDVIVKLADGNHAAEEILKSMLFQARIDPDNVMGALGWMLLLDSYSIFGVEIVTMYNDICKSNLIYFVAMLRACQLGMYDHLELRRIIQLPVRMERDEIAVQDMYYKVKHRLPRFNKKKEK